MQIRPFTPSDMEDVLAIWLEASLQEIGRHTSELQSR